MITGNDRLYFVNEADSKIWSATANDDAQPIEGINSTYADGIVQSKIILLNKLLLFKANNNSVDGINTGNELYKIVNDEIILVKNINTELLVTLRI